MDKQRTVLAIVGSRDFDDFEYMKECIQIITDQYKIGEIVSGGARGADFLSEQIAKNLNVPHKHFPADWDRLGKSAGFIRNKDIVNACDILAAFPIGESKGTKHSIKLARKANKTVFVFHKQNDEVIPSILEFLK